MAVLPQVHCLCATVPVPKLGENQALDLELGVSLEPSVCRLSGRPLMEGSGSILFLGVVIISLGAGGGFSDGSGVKSNDYAFRDTNLVLTPISADSQSHVTPPLF